jgi:hypothetical protein
MINICSQHVIDMFSKTPFSDNDEVGNFAPGVILNEEHQTYQQALARDPIALCRAVVRVIRASGQRRERFKQVILNGNQQKHWLGNVKLRDPSGQTRVEKGIVVLPVNELLRDVRTRWDSVYFMIRRFEELHQARLCFLFKSSLLTQFKLKAINAFLSLDENSDLKKYRVTPQELKVLKDCMIILSVRFILNLT